MTDPDNSKAYTRIVSISSLCSIQNLPANQILQGIYQFNVVFNGVNSNNTYSHDTVQTCTVVAVVGNNLNIESNQAVFTYHIENPLIPNTRTFLVTEGVETTLPLEMVAPNQTAYTGEVLFFYTYYPSHGYIRSTTPCRYLSHSNYFTIPSTDVYGKNLNRQNETVRLYAIHRGVATTDFPISIGIVNTNTIPQYVHYEGFFLIL